MYNIGCSEPIHGDDFCSYVLYYVERGENGELQNAEDGLSVALFCFLIHTLRASFFSGVDTESNGTVSWI